MDLDAIQRRLESLFTPATEPGLVKRLWGLGIEHADVEAKALGELIKVLRDGKETPAIRALHERAAYDELVRNVTVVEGLAASREHLPFAYVTWLWRVTETLRSLKRDPLQAPVTMLNLALSPRPTRQLQGFTLQPLLELASRETEILGRRRRLLEAARRALLESSAALDLLAMDVEPQLLAVTGAIQEITSLQEGGIDTDESLTHQLRRAVQLRDADAVRKLLDAAARTRELSPHSPALARRLGAMQRALSKTTTNAQPPTVEQAGARTFGQAAAQALLRGAARAQNEHAAPKTTAIDLVQAARSVDASFELGRTVAPVRAIEEQRRMALVPFPTQTLVLDAARSVNDLPVSLIRDPRLVIHQLATRSLLARRYLAVRKQRRPVVKRCAEARYYLLDGSSSMAGRRGRMRDAILISELSTLIRHLETGSATVRPIVYYRYFTKAAEPALKVETVEEALLHIERIVARPSRGETDIQGALIESFHHIDRERQRDPNLQRAHIVLISDGIADIDLWAVWRAREALGGMPVNVSVIALGGESPQLRGLAAQQRARGEHVFYHYLSDRAMHELMGRTRIARPPHSVIPEQQQAQPIRLVPLKLQPAAPLAPTPLTPEAWRELDQLVDELSILESPPEVDALEGAGLLEAAYEELGVSIAESGHEAERARAEAVRRDGRALASRFERWFPDPDRNVAHGVLPPAELLDVIEIIVVTVAELTEYLSGSALARSVDAIEILERLLLEAGVAPWGYLRALPHATERTKSALRVLRARSA